MKYFETSYSNAKKDADNYTNANEGQRSSLAFCGHGNLSRASTNTLQRINSVSHAKSMKAAIRKLMLELFNTQLFERREYEGINYIENVEWSKINQFLSKMNLYSAYTDETDYYQAETSNRLYDKIKAMIYFIERYGSNTDKRILIPKIKLD